MADGGCSAETQYVYVTKLQHNKSDGPLTIVTLGHHDDYALIVATKYDYAHAYSI